jgi:ATP-binding cassette subfamily B protein
MAALRRKIAQLSRYLLPHWRAMALMLFSSGLGMALGLLNPYIIKLVIDKAYAGRNLKLFVILTASGGAIYIISSALNSLSVYLSGFIKLRINFDLNRRITKKLRGLAYSYFQDNPSGSNLYRIYYDVEQVARLSASALPQAAMFAAQLFLITGIIFYLNWKIALFLLFCVSPLYILPMFFMNKLQEIIRKLLTSNQDIFSRMQEMFSHIRMIKAFGSETEELRGHIRCLAENIRQHIHIEKFQVYSSFTRGLFNHFIVGLIMFYGGIQLIKGHTTIGSLSALAIYLGQMVGLQSSLFSFSQELSWGLVSQERLEQLLEKEGGPKAETGSQTVFFSEGAIEFKGVTFGYKQPEMILKGLDFRMPGGCCIALVGPSGCGKTTVFNLILRLFQPWSGSILIDGEDIQRIKSSIFFAQVGAILEEPFLWNDTVANNIRYGKKGADLGEIQEAAQLACVDDFIGTLPLGYDTVIGEDACKISEGQKQRIAVARALIRRPKILLIDEAFSSLDALHETQILKNIREALAGSSIIIISHRLSTVMTADIAYFLSRPNQIVAAKPRELLEGNKEFYNLFQAQIIR